MLTFWGWSLLAVAASELIPGVLAGIIWGRTPDAHIRKADNPEKFHRYMINYTVMGAVAVTLLLNAYVVEPALKAFISLR